MVEGQAAPPEEEQCSCANLTLVFLVWEGWIRSGQQQDAVFGSGCAADFFFNKQEAEYLWRLPFFAPEVFASFAHLDPAGIRTW